MQQVWSEAELAQMWVDWHEGGDLVVRDALIVHYLPLVEFLAGRLARHVPDSYRSDLYGFGVLGLMDALQKFRPELGNRFETYGSRRIRGAMSDGIRALNWLPRRASEAASRVIEKIVPVDFKTSRTAVGQRWEDCLSDPHEEPVGEWLELADDHNEVIEAIQSLPERERWVISEYYYGARRLAEIGEELGVTESRVCQIHRRALRLLRDDLMARRQTA